MLICLDLTVGVLIPIQKKYSLSVFISSLRKTRRTHSTDGPNPARFIKTTFCKVSVILYMCFVGGGVVSYPEGEDNL